MIAELAAALAALSWSLAALLYKVGLRNFSPLQANVVRLTSATVFLAVFSTIREGVSWLHIFSYPVIVYAFANVVAALGVGDLCYFSSIKRIGVSRAVPIAYSFPLFMYPFATVVLKEELRPASLIAATLVVLGVYFVSSSSTAERSHALSAAGALYGVCTALSWSVSIVFLKLALQYTEVLRLNAGRMLLLLPPLLFAATITDSLRGLRLRAFRRSLFSLAIAGVLALGVGDSLLILALSMADATVVAPLSASSPLFSAILAAALLREKATIRLSLGALLVSIGAGLLLAYL